MANDTTQQLAEKIALLLHGNEQENSDFSIIRASLEKINERLDKIESNINSPQIHPLSLILHSSTAHPSQEKFTTLEDLADETINNLQNEEACPYEPSGKPCDHCAMCNSRGF